MHDTVDKTWRHLDFFQHRALLHVRLPRVRCPEHGVRQVDVPWARPGSGFTLLFEALVCSFATVMPIAKVAAMTGEHDTRIWRVVEHHVTAARDQLRGTGVHRVGMEETSARKGQDYIGIFADLDARRVVFATEGRCAETVARFAADLATHGGDPAEVTDTSSDMSTAFISGIRAHLPNARMTFDRLHLAAKLSEAIDTVRRTEVTTRPELKHTRRLWLKNWANLSVTQRRELHHLIRPSAQPATARALRRREDFPAFYDQDPSYAPEYPRRWCYGAERSRLQPIKDFVILVEKHWEGIIAWHANHLSNGLLEGINSLIQAAKARTRGYRSKNKMITIVYLTAAKLQLPTLTHPEPAYMTSR
ncbi:MAG: ISL3 family transposase [Pseudonocardiales bacterium]|nr:ISL3 family transposase [Pseudonocardiales bacterium]MBV9032582.1 ISL3 family transposase [Pseudonocardiales bacterium]MBW0010573.1 ISL3 family transposase [Pseudonocardiales bacterium]